jgi:hypothetical protein
MPNENGKYIASEGICDFCSSSDLFCGYLASDFTAAEVAVPNVCTFVLNSLGAWLACRECTRLIEQENWEGLLERSFRTFCETHGPELVLTPEDERVIREFLRHIHAQFRRFRGSGTQPSAKCQSFAGVN